MVIVQFPMLLSLFAPLPFLVPEVSLHGEALADGLPAERPVPRRRADVTLQLGQEGQEVDQISLVHKTYICTVVSQIFSFFF